MYTKGATKGPWFTAAHIEFAKQPSTPLHPNFSWASQVSNHCIDFGQSGNNCTRKNVVIELPLRAHIVLTGRSVSSDGTVQWALVHKREGVTFADSKRANRLFGHFGRAVVKVSTEWRDRYGLDLLVELVEGRDWRLALRERGKARLSDLEASSSDTRQEVKTIESFCCWRDVLEQWGAFQATDYKFDGNRSPKSHRKSIPREGYSVNWICK